MYYHASSIKDLSTLEPHISNHDIPLIYLSKKRENVLVYLSNAIQKYCIEQGFEYSGIWQKWASYGFDKDGIQRIEEYYPNALIDTYKGVSGYIYFAEMVEDSGFQTQIPDAVTSEKPIVVNGCEYIEDAYEAIIAAKRQGLVRILRYNELSPKMKNWLKETTITEYEQASEHPEYRFFLEAKFGDLLKQ